MFSDMRASNCCDARTAQHAIVSESTTSNNKEEALIIYCFCVLAQKTEINILLCIVQLELAIFPGV